MQGVRIAGVGNYAPERVLTNADFEKMFDTSDEWIVTRTGMRERHIARDDEPTSDMALAASRTSDERYQEALVEYMEEERGHEKWILDDIRAVGGDPDSVRTGTPGLPGQIMVG